MASPGDGIATESISLRGSGAGEEARAYTHTHITRARSSSTGYPRTYTELPSKY